MLPTYTMSFLLDLLKLALSWWSLISIWRTPAIIRLVTGPRESGQLKLFSLTTDTEFQKRIFPLSRRPHARTVTWLILFENAHLLEGLTVLWGIILALQVQQNVEEFTWYASKIATGWVEFQVPPAHTMWRVLPLTHDTASDSPRWFNTRNFVTKLISRAVSWRRYSVASKEQMQWFVGGKWKQPVLYALLMSPIDALSQRKTAKLKCLNTGNNLQKQREIHSAP